MHSHACNCLSAQGAFARRRLLPDLQNLQTYREQHLQFHAKTPQFLSNTAQTTETYEETTVGSALGAGAAGAAGALVVLGAAMIFYRTSRAATGNGRRAAVLSHRPALSPLALPCARPDCTSALHECAEASV